jgi:hypothetical protein
MSGGVHKMAASDTKVPTRELTSKSAYIALLFALPVLLVFLFFGKWEMGIGAWICGGLVMLVLKTRWDLRGSLWFWMSIGVALLVQVPIVLLIPWGNRGLTGISLLPVAVVDYGLVYGCVKLAEKMASKNEGSGQRT